MDSLIEQLIEKRNKCRDSPFCHCSAFIKKVNGSCFKNSILLPEPQELQ